MRNPKIKLSFIILTYMVIMAGNISAQDPNFYIFLCFGQSNMEGQGTIEAQDKTVDSRFQVMEALNCSNLGRTKGHWYTAVPPLCRCNNGLSPADYFGRTMVANLPAEIKVGVINVSVAGCKIELFDKGKYQAYAATAPSWMKNIINEYGGDPYGRLIEIAKLAKKDGVIKGILMHQGESNTGETNWPSQVKVVIDNLMTDLELDPTNVPLLAGEVVHADQGGVCASMNSIIAKLPQTIPNSYVISSSKCTDGSDNLHFNSAGYRELGTRYAVKMLSLLGIEVTGIEEQNLSGINPTDYLLYQNYPNPFNPVTLINYSIPEQGYVSLKIFDTLGNEIASLVNEEKSVGTHSVSWNAENVTSGIYFYTIKSGSFVQTKKLTLLK